MSHEAFGSSFKIFEDPSEPHDDIEMGRAGPDPYVLDMFAKDVDNVKEDMKDLERLYSRVHESNEDVKIAQNSMGMRELREEMNGDLDHIQKLAKLINKKYGGLVRANAAQRKITESGPVSLDDNARATMLSELGDDIMRMMRKFQGLRVQMETDHRQLIESRYFAITREKATAEAIDSLIASDAPEGPLQHAMQEHGHDVVLDTVAEIQERRGSMMEIRRSLMALHQILLEIATPVAATVVEGQVDAIKGGGGGPLSPSPGGPMVVPAKAGTGTGTGTGGLNDYERETRNQAYIGMAVALVIIISLITWLLSVEKDIESDTS